MTFNKNRCRNLQNMFLGYDKQTNFLLPLQRSHFIVTVSIPV